MRNAIAFPCRRLALLIALLAPAPPSLAETFSAASILETPAKAQQHTSPDQVPDGLGKSDWQSIRAAHEAWKHGFHPVECGHTAHTPAQAWRSHFDARGFSTRPSAEGGWQWGMELQSYGFPRHEQYASSHPQTVAAGQRLTRTWDGTLQEWYVNDGTGLEHGFTVAKRPPGAEGGAALGIELSVRGTLRAQVQTGGQAVNFVDANGTTALTYGGLKVWDADGRVLPARMTATATGNLRFEVEERDACYPLTVDPIAQQAYLKQGNNGPSHSADFFGGSVAVSGDTVVVGAYGESGGGSGVNPASDESAPSAGAAYVFVRSGTVWSQHAYLKASNTGAGDEFGRAVAVSGDTVVVGGWKEDGSGSGVDPASDENAKDAGAAYVFVRSGATWSQQACLKASNMNVEDNFGVSVAVSGDTVVVGANGEDGSGTGVNPAIDEATPYGGAAWVFIRSGTDWSQQAYLKASNTGQGDQFGGAVAVSGDTIVAGAVSEDGSGTGINPASNNSASWSGAAYIFTRSGTEWSPQAYLKASNTETDDWFGISVAVSGDTVVVGAHQEDGSGTGSNPASNESASNAGAAYVFVRNSGTWSQQAYLKASNTGAGDNFSRSVAVSGDTLVVGASSERGSGTGVNPVNDDGAIGAGAAYVFLRSGTVWVQQAYLKASNTGVSDFFGLSVSVSGDMVVVGARGEDGNGTGIDPPSNEVAEWAGAAYVFSRSGAVWSPPAYFKASNTTTGFYGEGDYFGWSVAVSGDTAVVGAYVESGTGTGVNPASDEGARASGAVYVFVRSGGMWSQQAYLKASNSQAGDNFGYSVAVSGNTVVVGAIQEDGSGTGVNPPENESANAAGAAYVFIRSGTAWSQQAYLKASNTGADDYFGVSVAVSGDTVVVGASAEDGSGKGINPASNESANAAGAAYVFILNGVVWSQQAYLKASNAGVADGFGVSVAVSGATVVVGAPGEDGFSESVDRSGAVYVFVRSGTVWSQQAYFKASNAGRDDAFGQSVAVSGGTIVVGAPYENGSGIGVNPVSDNNGYQSGAAYVFLRSGTLWSQQAYLKASNTGAGDGSSLTGDTFGQSVAVSGDTAVVGAIFEDGSGTGVNPVSNESMVDAGAAYVFVRSGTVWSQQAYLKAFNAGSGDLFGFSVAVSGDTVLAGAIGERGGGAGVNPVSDESATSSGAAYIFNGLGPPAPEIVVEQPAGTSLIDGTASILFGGVAIGNSSATLTFTVKNTGTAALILGTITKDGAHPGDFTVAPPGTATVDAGGSTAFTVTFSPGAGGDRTAALHIPSNDADEGIFDINLAGAGLTAIQVWRQSHFGTADNTGNAANAFDADCDNLSNLIEYAFGLDPLSADGGMLPQPQYTGSNLVATFSQPAVVNGILYGAEWSTVLQPGSWTPIADTGSGSTHNFSTPAEGIPRMFMRFNVTEQ